MKTIEIKLYSISELSDKPKQRAIEKWRDLYDIDIDYIIEDWKIKLRELGYLDAEIRYSGFWSPGDGASFTVKNFHPTEAMIDKAKCTKEYYDEIMSLSFKIVRDRWTNYVHWNTVSVYLIDPVDDIYLLDEISKLEDSIFEHHHELSDAIYHDLEEAYDYENTDEYIVENIELNECLFLANGTIWRESNEL